MSKKLNGAELLQLILDGKVKFGYKFNLNVRNSPIF